jgi:hypothetical protein
MRGSRVAATLCLLVSLFAILMITVKPYALLWWVAGMVTTIAAGAFVVSKRQ